MTEFIFNGWLKIFLIILKLLCIFTIYFINLLLTICNKNFLRIYANYFIIIIIVFVTRYKIILIFCKCIFTYKLKVFKDSILKAAF